MKLEVIATSLVDIKDISKNQCVDQIEYCSDLEVGGLTPLSSNIRKAVELTSIPINVMLRPTDRSFNYSEHEFQQMVKDAQFIASTNVHGVVFGILNDQNEIDVERMKIITKILHNKHKVFHKAFDLVGNLNKSLMILKNIGINAVLTAGGTKPIIENLAVLKALKDQCCLAIVAGGGVNYDNLQPLVKVSDVIHVGRLARVDESWSKPIDHQKIQKIKAMMKEVR